MWTRNCPDCGSQLFHKSEKSKYEAIRRRCLCRNCSERAKRRSTEWKRECSDCHTILTYRDERARNRAEHKQKKCMSCCQKGNIPWIVGRKHTEETRAKIRAKRATQVFTEETRLKLCKARAGKPGGMLGKKHKPESIEKMMKWRVHNHGLQPHYNPVACRVFDEINKELGWNGQHAERMGEYMVGPYWVDYYDSNLNVVIEYDEKHHKKPYLQDRQAKREVYIKERLNCKFYRIAEQQNWREVLSEYLQ